MGVLHVDVVSLFPEMFAPVIGLSIVGRAVERGLVDVRMHHLLDALDGRGRADERPYGGGPGMVLRIEPLARTLDAILATAPPDERRRIVLTSASGRVFRQADAAQWAQLDRLVLICGHYEGVDERLGALYPVDEVSLGEFVLTGGEIAALAFLDATVRLVPGAIDAESAAAESWAGSELDHPAFTRPPTFRGVDVPAVLLSGDHAKIAAWRREQSRERAAARNHGRSESGYHRSMTDLRENDAVIVPDPPRQGIVRSIDGDSAVVEIATGVTVTVLLDDLKKSPVQGDDSISGGSARS